MKGPTPRRLCKYAARCLGLQAYLEAPGDGRESPRIAARALLWGLLMGRLLRECSFLGVEALVRSPARRALPVPVRFGDDALAYFTERLDARATRQALAAVLRRSKRNKAFDDSRFLGLAVDGTTGGRRSAQGNPCQWCRPFGKKGTVFGYRHHLAMLSVVGTGLTLPLDVEPYGPGDSEYTAALRLLRRAVGRLGVRFADYLVADGEYARAPFLHAAGKLGLRVIVRLKTNLPELFEAAQRRFAHQPPHTVFFQDGDRVELWDADDFDPWETLRWKTVRVLRYRQTKPNGKVFDALWLTDFSPRRVNSRQLYRLAKTRWEIENQGFNDAKNRYGLEHLCHHHPNSMLLVWLLTLLALVIERLYRLRYLHRGTHPRRTAIELLRLLWRGLSSVPLIDTS